MSFVVEGGVNVARGQVKVALRPEQFLIIYTTGSQGLVVVDYYGNVSMTGTLTENMSATNLDTIAGGV